MAKKADFTEQEWESLQKGVMGAGLLVSVSDRSFFDSFKEAGALAKHVTQAKRGSSSELLREAEWSANIWLCGMLLFFGDYAGGRACVLEALRICQTLRKRRGELSCLSTLALIDFYTGVLYEALDVETLSAAAKRRLTTSTLVFSALWGAVRLDDRIPAYRMAIGVKLPLTGLPAS